MERYRTIDGWRFEWNEDNEFYECRGDVYHDDDHDEIPEPELWDAALKLEQELKDDAIEYVSPYTIFNEIGYPIEVSNDFDQTL